MNEAENGLPKWHSKSRKRPHACLLQRQNGNKKRVLKIPSLPMTVTLAVSKHACIEQQKVYACFGPPPHTNLIFLFHFLGGFDADRNQNDLRVSSSIVVISFRRTNPNIFIVDSRIIVIIHIIIIHYRMFHKECIKV